MAQPPASNTDSIESGILLTSGLVHSFIQGIIVSQVGRYYEDYYHLDTLSMKTYVGSIVVISLYVCHRQYPGCRPELTPGKPKCADDIHQLQSLGGHPSKWRSESYGICHFHDWLPPSDSGCRGC